MLRAQELQEAAFVTGGSKTNHLVFAEWSLPQIATLSQFFFFWLVPHMEHFVPNIPILHRYTDRTQTGPNPVALMRHGRERENGEHDTEKSARNFFS